MHDPADARCVQACNALLCDGGLMPDSAEVDDFRVCPVCGYGLRGLPDVRKCPECGFDCDPLATIFRLTTRGSDISYIAQFVILLMFFCIVAMTGRTIDDGRMAILGFLAVAIAFHGVHVARRFGAASAIIANRTGVHFNDAGRVVIAIPWSQIARVDCSGVTGALIVRDQRGKKLLRVGVVRFAKSQVAKRCAAEINRLAIAYRGRDFASDESST
jgi:hypothetical protein